MRVGRRAELCNCSVVFDIYFSQQMPERYTEDGGEARARRAHTVVLTGFHEPSKQTGSEARRVADGIGFIHRQKRVD